MGSINMSIGALTGSHTVDNTKLQNILRLFGAKNIEGFADMTNQQKADAVCQQFYLYAREEAWQQRKTELRRARAAEDEAALNEL